MSSQNYVLRFSITWGDEFNAPQSGGLKTILKTDMKRIL